ncbi:hypothetical protein ACBJ59_36435 [Nonomuraea sp. MTCD27]|uniref:hypothetical protein n=1 Tax=Nonomuraea sp. MTCD27 TaxID=1676747 RepID=UPI0035C1FEDA
MSNQPKMTADGKHMICSEGLLWTLWESSEDPWTAKADNPSLRICGWKNAYWYLPDTTPTPWR